MFKFRFISVCVLICLLILSCAEKAPLEFKPPEIDSPDSPPNITSSQYTDGIDFSEGYYSGLILSDRTNLQWEPSTDTNFLAYKIYRANGIVDSEEDENNYFDFENGQIDSSTWFLSYFDNYGNGYYGGWFISDDANYTGNYGIATPSGSYYNTYYLNTEIDVPAYSYINVSFYTSEPNSEGDGDLLINGESVLDWDYNSSSWDYESVPYYTGNNTLLQLTWQYQSYMYGQAYIDDISIIVEDSNVEYTLVETFIDQSANSFFDTNLVQDQYYTYKIANIINTSAHKAENLVIKTPQWQAPGNVYAIGLSPEVVELHWDDDSESETEFIIYVGRYYLDSNFVYQFDYEVSTTANRDDTTKIITGLIDSLEYIFRVIPNNSWEQEFPEGSSDEFTFEFDPPTNLYASQNIGLKSVNLTWEDNANLETGFEIERDVGSGFQFLSSVNTNTTTYIDTDTTGFEIDSTYTYRVRAHNDYNGNLYTEYSNEDSVILSELSGVFENFENGQIPIGWDHWGYTGWYVTSDDAYEGNFSIHCLESSYSYEYLETTFDVPQNTEVTISFYHKGYNDGYGNFYINDNNYLNWGSDYFGNSWYFYQELFYTGSSNQITLFWRYNTQNYGRGYLDNISVTW